MNTAAVIVAAGSSTRAGFDKIFATLAGKPVLAYSIEAFRAAGITEIVAVTQESNLERVLELGVTAVNGGANRAESVRNGVAAISGEFQYIAIHDGARPLVTSALIARVVEGAKLYKAAIPAIAVKDTVKVIQGEFVAHTPDRSTLVAVQTPQVFDLALYRELMGEDDITDDCTLFERAGVRAKIVAGDERNIKITTATDLIIAEELQHGLY